MDNTQRWAVRPNLNKSGVLTIHPVRHNGNPDYSRAAAHTKPGDEIILTNPFFHVSQTAVEKIRNGLSNKFPCASVIGNIVTDKKQLRVIKSDNTNYFYTEIFFNPRKNNVFVYEDGTPVNLNGTEKVKLFRTTAFIMRYGRTDEVAEDDID